MCLPQYPALNGLISAHQGGDAGIGPYWSQPGRSIVEGLLDAVPFPVSPAHTTATDQLLASLPDLEDPPPVHPVAAGIAEPAPVPGSSGWDPSTAVRLKSNSDGDKYYLRRRWRSPQLEGYLRSASALHTYHEKHPDDKAKRGSKEGDIVERLVGKIREGLREEGVDIDKNEVEFAWPLVLMMIKRET